MARTPKLPLTIRAVVAAALVASGCAVSHSLTLRNVATAKVAPEERSALWSRALREFQARGILVSVSDREGGVLASHGQPSSIECGHRDACSSVSLVQLTLCDDGETSLRINRVVSGVTLGYGDLLARDERETLEREPAELLAAILGKPVGSVRAKTDTPRRSGPRRSAIGTPCNGDSECPTGYTCSLATCRR
jgi:hypothetical protein